MFAVLEGQISDDQDLREVLEIVLNVKDVQNGVLRITCNEFNGRIGIFCGRYITGAKVSSTDETGEEALKKLLTVQKGNFAFLDAKGQDISDLKQSLSIEIDRLLELLPNSIDDAVRSQLEDSWLLINQSDEIDETHETNEVFSKPDEIIESPAIDEPKLVSEPIISTETIDQIASNKPVSSQSTKREFNRLKSWHSKNFTWVKVLAYLIILGILFALIYWVNPKIITQFIHLIRK